MIEHSEFEILSVVCARGNATFWGPFERKMKSSFTIPRSCPNMCRLQSWPLQRKAFRRGFSKFWHNILFYWTQRKGSSSRDGGRSCFKACTDVLDRGFWPSLNKRWMTAEPSCERWPDGCIGELCANAKPRSTRHKHLGSRTYIISQNRKPLPVKQACQKRVTPRRKRIPLQINANLDSILLTIKKYRVTKCGRIAVVLDLMMPH